MSKTAWGQEFDAKLEAWAEIGKLRQENLVLTAQLAKQNQALIAVKARGHILYGLVLRLIQGGELLGSDWDYISENQYEEVIASLKERLDSAKKEAFYDGYLESLGDPDSIDREHANIRAVYYLRRQQ